MDTTIYHIGATTSFSPTVLANHLGDPPLRVHNWNEDTDTMENHPLSIQGYKALEQWFGKGQHIGTLFSHIAKFNKCIRFMILLGIWDIFDITQEHLDAFASSLVLEVKRGSIARSTAVNYISSANRVIFCYYMSPFCKLPKGSIPWVRPSTVARRSHVRRIKPKGLSLAKVYQAATIFKRIGFEIGAVVILACRLLGLRRNEALQADYHALYKQAKKDNSVRITRGTKGGTGKLVYRGVTCSPQIIRFLERARKVQGDHYRLVPAVTKTHRLVRRLYYYYNRYVRPVYDLGCFHDLRVAYACALYKAITGVHAPCVRKQSRRPARDRYARECISQAFGHGRYSVCKHYVGACHV